jgi:Rieske 2Fe-2S family protein
LDRSERKTLERVEESLPRHFYVDPAHYRRELAAIWYASWIYGCRVEQVARSRDFQRVEVGDQSVIVTRDDEGRLRAYHNTCRHRGSVLCSEPAGRFRGPAIVCPYHQWTYSLDGELRATPRRLDSPDFRFEDYPLYRVAVAEWGGHVFIHLGSSPPPLESALGQAPQRLASWRLEDLRVGHRSSRIVECNWKIFWENFSECLHCPVWHPELSRLVPIYGKGLVSELELPDSEHTSVFDSDGPEAPLAPGAVTWSLDGQTSLPPLPGLSEAERSAGQTFGTVEPSFFVIAHSDYVRSARILPLGTEQTEISMEWLFPAEVLARDDFDVERVTELGKRVVEQDARACELNQQGLRALPHEHGVLVKQEYWVRHFQLWVQARLDEAG